MPHWILHLETSGPTCSVALSDGPHCIDVMLDASGDHNAVLAVYIKNILMYNNLNLKNLSAISVNIGPGSYTALRIGVVMAKTLAFANRLPLIGAMGLEALFKCSMIEYPDHGFYLPLIDARRDDVYFALYGADGVPIIPAQFATLDEAWLERLGVHGQSLVIAGSGSEKFSRIFADKLFKTHTKPLDASTLVPIGWDLYNKNEFSEVSTLLPFYMKDPNITSAKKKL